MFEAFGLGLLAQSSLLIAGVAVCWLTIPARVVGVLACGVAAALGFLATEHISAANGDHAAALAAGGLLAMLTNSLMPFAFERGGALAGAATAAALCVSVLGS